MKIIKRDGSEVPYDYRKIQNAITAANGEVAEEDRLSDTEVGFIVGRIERRCDELGRSVGVEEIQDMIIDELDQSEHYRLARHYADYRLRHELLRKQNSTDAKILSLLRHDNDLAKQENANKDPVINSTMRDTCAAEYAQSHGLKLKVFKPEYDRYGKGAPLKRNITIIEYTDQVLAFWDGKSHWTKYVIDECKKRGIPVQVFLFDSTKNQ